MKHWELYLIAALMIALPSGYAGYKLAQVELEHHICGSYDKGHSTWRGWLSVKDGVYRCFYVESEYPWRVRHGVKLVEGK
jgi:hypothetical protein